MAFRRPPALDPAFHRIARKLRTFELMRERGEDPFLDADDIELRPGTQRGRTATTFLNFYSKDGLLYGMKAYGIHEMLVERGLGDYELEVTCEDAFHHRLEIFVARGTGEEQRIMDLRVHLRQVAWPGEERARDERVTIPVLVIEWLAMQNPRARFTKERPRLPGQKYPGSGFGRAMHNILIIMAERTAREAILNVPEHFHLAALYLRAGYRYPATERESELHAVLDATSHLPFAAAAWAVERGFVLEEVDGDTRPWRYMPEEMMLPLSAGLRRRLPGLMDRLAERVFYPRRRRFFVDDAGLEASLLDHPVEGLEGFRLSR